MNAEHERLKEILAEATAKASATERAVYLDEACRGDQALRARPEAMSETGESLDQFAAPEEDSGDPRDNGMVLLGFSPDGNRFLAACFGAKARIWDVETGTLLRSLEGHEFVIYSAVYSPDGRRVATASYDATVRLWDAVSGEELLSSQPGSNRMTAVRFSPDGRYLAAGLAHYKGDRSTLFEWSCADRELSAPEQLLSY